MKLQVYTAICHGGPMDKRVRAVTGAKTFVPGTRDKEGFYRFSAARGPEPARWVWVEKKV